MGCSSSSETKSPSKEQLDLEDQEHHQRVALIRLYWSGLSDLHPFATDKVLLHNTDADVWVVIHGRVYDCTKWQFIHPGGSKPIMRQAGKDCSEVFDQLHSATTKKSILPTSKCEWLIGGAFDPTAGLSKHGFGVIFDGAFEEPQSEASAAPAPSVAAAEATEPKKAPAPAGRKNAYRGRRRKGP